MNAIGGDGMPIEVLLVEDSPGDVRLTQEAFRDANRAIHLHVASDGVEAMAFLRHEGAHADAPRPDLILLDLNLPRMDGREVLAQIKEDDSLKTIPTVILTTSEAEADIVKSYQLQANCYLSKPVQLEAFESLVKSINDFWLTKVKLPQQTRQADEHDIDQDGSPGRRQSGRRPFAARDVQRARARTTSELTHVECMSEAERIWRAMRSTSSCSISGCPMRRAWQRCAGPTPPRRAFPLVVLTGLDDESLAAQALQEGAQDYLIKGQIDDARPAAGPALRHRAQDHGRGAVRGEGARPGHAQLHRRRRRLHGHRGQHHLPQRRRGKDDRLVVAGSGGRPMAEVFRILDATSREATPTPMEMAVGQDRDVHLPPNCILSGATDSKFRSKIRLPRSTTAKGRRPAR